jgi:hypothetical protein
MNGTSSKHFGPFRDDYAFFLQHSTEAGADVRAYAPHLQGLCMGDTLIRMLDFGCGDAGFTFKRLFRGETLYNYWARLRHKNCLSQNVLIASSVLFDNDGNFVHTRCFTVLAPANV